MFFVFVLHLVAGKMVAEAMTTHHKACGPKSFLCPILAALTRDPEQERVWQFLMLCPHGEVRDGTGAEQGPEPGRAAASVFPLLRSASKARGTLLAIFPAIACVSLLGTLDLLIHSRNRWSLAGGQGVFSSSQNWELRACALLQRAGEDRFCTCSTLRAAHNCLLVF